MILRFGDFELDEELYQLRHAGRAVPLEPKPFDVLRTLVAGRNVVVSKDDLLAAVWPDEFVTEAVLHRCMSLVRKALGDEEAKALVSTVRGRGYRFTGEVESADARASRGDDAAPTALVPVQEVFLGRDPVLQQIEQHRADADAGHGRVLLLVGEPGIGKTRTVEAWLENLSSDAPAFVGRCFEGDGSPPYWPWVQVLRALVERTADPEVAGLCDRLEGALDEIGEGREQRFRLFDAVARALSSAGGEHAAVVVLEDLHWADAPSLLLLQNLAHVIGDRRVLVLATLRDERRPRDHPFAQMRGDLARLGHVHRIGLEGLDRDQVAEFLKQSLGRQAPSQLLDVVCERTDGNPLFLREVVRWILAQPQLDWAEFVPEWEVVLPDGLRDVIERRIDALGARVARVLEAAAVIGRDFDPMLLVDVLGEERELLDVPLEAARAARVIEPLERGFTFSHAMVRETLLESLPQGARADWHARVGEGLEKRHAGDLEPVLGELAHHFFEAHPLGGEERALSYAEAAADNATRRLAWEEAVAHLRRAIALLERSGARDRERLYTFWCALGRAWRAVGDVGATRDAFVRAAELALERGDADAYAGHVLDALGPGSWGPAERELGDRFLATALELHTDPSVRRARLLARKAVHLHQWNELDAALETSVQALDEARRHDDAGALADALITRASSLHAEIHDPGGLARYDAVIDEVCGLFQLGTGDGRPLPDGTDMRQTLREWRAGRALLDGDGSRFRQEIAGVLRLTDGAHHPSDVWSGLQARAAVALLEGRNDEAQAKVAEALRLGTRFNLPWSGAGFLGASLELARTTGRLATVVDRLDDLLGNFDFEADLLRGIALSVPVEAGQPERSRPDFEAWVADGLDRIRRDHEWLVVMTDLATVACGLHHLEAAELLYGLLLPYAGQHRALWDINVYMGPVAARLADLAVLLGRSGEARTHAESALAGTTAMGAVSHAALARKRLERLS